MEEKDGRMIAREPWRRLLQRGADAPPETTDARIRAAARRPLAKHPARWWLPASLAASFVLAFMLVQSQFGEKPAPASVGEPGVAEPGLRARREPARDAAADAYTLPERNDQGAPAEAVLDRAPPAESPAGGLWAGPRSQPARAPEVERPAEQESAAAAAGADGDAAASKELHNTTVTGSRQHESKLETTTPVTGVTATAVSATRYRSPEAWYAAIEALRADGRTEEADRELEQLEKAHPGWVNEHLAEQERQRQLDRR